MSEIGLLMTSILSVRQLSPQHRLPNLQPLQIESSSEHLSNSVSKLVKNPSQIAPPEFIPTDAISQTTSSAPHLPQQRLLASITTSQISPSFSRTNYQARATTRHNSIKVAAVSSSSSGFTGQSLPTLRFGTSGTAVRVLQRLLVSKGYAIRVDGSFGALTETAVKAFQSQRRLVVDGVVGPVTWQQLTM